MSRVRSSLRAAVVDAPPLTGLAPRHDDAAWPTPAAFACHCGRALTLGATECPGCHSALGYLVESRQLLRLAPIGVDGLWRDADAAADSRRHRRCANLRSASACNWLVDESDPPPGQPALCCSCRLTRVLPDLRRVDNALAWQRMEAAKRKLVATLIGLRLPVSPRSASTDGPQGLAFDLVREQPGGAPVHSGHADGVITVDLEDVDDATRARRRIMLHEPERKLLGQLRHDSGGYYWQRLVRDAEWLSPFRQLFGDERADRESALIAHLTSGPPADWRLRHVNPWASSHPIEDWAESWAHYLQIVDTLDAVHAASAAAAHPAPRPDGVDDADLPVGGGARSADAQREGFAALLDAWVGTIVGLNALARGVGMADVCVPSLSPVAVDKLYFVHRVIAAAAARRGLRPRAAGAALNPPSAALSAALSSPAAASASSETVSSQAF